MKGKIVKDNGPRIDTTRFPAIEKFGPEEPVQDSQGQAWPAFNKTPTCSVDGYAELRSPRMTNIPDHHRTYPVLRELETILRDGTSFSDELKKLLNKHSEENASNTPDFILATFLVNCLDTFNASVKAREKWYGRKTF